MSSTLTTLYKAASVPHRKEWAETEGKNRNTNRKRKRAKPATIHKGLGRAVSARCQTSVMVLLMKC
jgi:hypothetical protein